jgi:hypothetical protein
MGLAAPVMSLAGAGFGAMGSIMGGEGQAAADQYKAEMLNREAEYGRLAATQTNAAMTRNIADTLSRIDAVRAASHVNPASPTGAEVRGQTEYLANEQKGIRVENILQQATLDDSQAAYLRSAASTAMLSGDIGAAGGILGGLTKFAGGLQGLNLGGIGLA